MEPSSDGRPLLAEQAPAPRADGPQQGGIVEEAELNTQEQRRLARAARQAATAANTATRRERIQEPPQALRDLLSHDVARAKQFRQQIRAYNCSLQLASSTLKDSPQDAAGAHQRGLRSVRMHGRMYHRIGPLLPAEGQERRFAQLWIYDATYDGAAAANARSAVFNGSLDVGVLTALQRMLEESNPLVQRVQMAVEIDDGSEEATIVIDARGHVGRDHERQWNAPVDDQVAAIMPGDGAQAYDPRVVTLRLRAGGLMRIHDCNALCFPTHFVLLFPRGEPGWHPGIPKIIQRIPAEEAGPGAAAAQLDEGEEAPLPQLADGPADPGARQCKSVTLRQWLAYRMHDALRRGDTDASNLGRAIILPSSHSGSPRQMQQLYQDAMAIVRKHGKPDLFITITCNPQWREIQEELLPGQAAVDRPDLVDRVFKLKLDFLLNLLTEQKILGKTIAKIFVVEFQKRGLPHAHILIILAGKDKLRTPEDIDRVPPKHRGMEGGDCTKRFPRDWQDEPTVPEDGYPLYRRRNDGRTVSKGAVPLDNRWVCHINVEVVSSISAVKYLYKYVYKRPDMPLHEEAPNVVRLDLHLPDEQTVYYEDGADLAQLAAAKRATKLTAWFKLNETDPDARAHLYIDIPTFYTWHAQRKVCPWNGVPTI
ncbi:hypothetical protein ABPG75_003733 [Micractinium tetrahymenae]